MGLPGTKRRTRRLEALAACGLLLTACGMVAQTPVPLRPPSESAPKRSQPACPEAEGPDVDPTYTLRAQAFDDIAAGDATGARRLMRCAVDKMPNDKVALRQLVYLDLESGDDNAASRDIDRLRELNDSDAHLEAQQGYIFAKQNRYADARAAFRRALKTADPELKPRVIEAMRNMDPAGAARVLDVDLDSQYVDRFDDGIVDLTVRFYQRLGDSPFRAYLNARLLRDTASQVGPLPQIFDDNAFLSGVGVAFQPAGAHYSVTAEANEAYVFYAGRSNTAALVPDFRVQAGYYNVFRREATSRLGLEANGSVGFYSRYQHDAISYLQPRVVYDLARDGELRVSPYFEGSMAFDTNQQYYNNIGEAIPGVEFRLKRVANLALRAEYVRGYYLPFHSNSPNPYGTSYNDFRVRLLLYKSVPVGH